MKASGNRRFGLVLSGLVLLASATVVKAQTPTTLALPAQSVLFAPIYIAMEKGIFRARGLDLKLIYVAGPGVMNAVLGGSADFTLITGGTHIAAAVRNQKLLAIANTQDKVTTDIVIRGEIAKKINLPADADVLTKMKALKGLTIGVDAINGLPHSILRFLAVRAGLNPETDMTITALQPPAMVSALKAGTIDAMVFSPPFSLLAVKEGGVNLISGPEVRQPEFESFPYNVVLVRPDFCNQDRKRCKAFVDSIKEAAELMQSDPASSLKSLAVSFDKMDPALLETSFKVFAPLASRDLKLTSRMYTSIVSFNRISGVIPPDSKVPPEAELYSTEFTAD